MASARLAWGLLGLAMVGIVGGAAWHEFQNSTGLKSPKSAAALPSYAKLPEFELRTAAGQTFTNADLKGHTWVVDFIFTSCAGQCPALTAQMRGLQDQLPERARLLSVSVDPARDTPQALADYAGKSGANPARWEFATGTPEAIQKLVQEGFHLSVADGGPEEEPITHSVRLVLVDEAGVIRGYYDGMDPKAVQQLTKDLRRLTQELK